MDLVFKNVSSSNPADAIISLSNVKQSTHEIYVAVQDILTKAYYELRKEYAKNIFKKDPSQLIRFDLKAIKLAYHLSFSEAEIKK